MTTLEGKALWIATAALAAVTAASLNPARADEAERYQQLLKERSPAMVTIKFVLKMQSGGEEQEKEDEATGVIIDPKGLVLCSNTQLGGFAGLLRALGRGSGITANPTDIKVLVGDDTEGLEATFVARDSELDLAWVRIKDIGDHKLTCVDLNKATSDKPVVGQPVLAIRRMGKFFDRTPIIQETRIGGVARKPRELYLTTTDFVETVGLPVFTSDGRVLGVTIVPMPGEGDVTEDAAALLQDIKGGAILPAGVVAKATTRAMANAQAGDTPDTTPADKPTQDSPPGGKATTRPADEEK